MQSLPAKGYFTRTAEYDLKQWFVLLPEGAEYKDLFRPDFWLHHAGRLTQHDLVRVRAADGSFDVQLCVKARAPGGVFMEEWPRWPADEQLEAAKAETVAALEVRQVNGKPVPRVEHTPRTKWRLIGLDGNEVSRNHDTKELAEVEMVKYVAMFGKELA